MPDTALLLDKKTRHALDGIHKKPGGTYIFVGPANVGKFTAAYELGMVLSGQQPYSIQVIRPQGKSIGIEQIKDLQRSMPFKSNKQYRTVIIDQAHLMTLEAQSAFLKTLEEPPLYTTIILVVEGLVDMLPTVVSRAQILRFPLLNESNLKSVVNGQTTELILRYANGAVGKAINLLNEPAFLKQHQELEQAIITLLVEKDLYRRMLLVQASLNCFTVWQLLDAAISYTETQLRKEIGHNTMIEVATKSQRLHLLYQISQYLNANGNPKFAFDWLVMEY